jgi:tRNA nucleotidyltransferase/poly(A) polymerase
MEYKLYEVGGKIRDEFLGINSKDIDYSVVIDNPSRFDGEPENAVYELKEQLLNEGFDVFLTTPEVYTIRAMFPKDHKYSGVADFVIARKEIDYIAGTRTPNVVLGTLQDDLIRRDFTVNCMAKDGDGFIVDPFGGQKDLLDGILRTPTDAGVAFKNDPLRLLRALRFSVTKNLIMSEEIQRTIMLFNAKDLSVVSDDRVREEMYKMFRFDTKEALKQFKFIQILNDSLYDEIFSRDLWLMPTNKDK